MLSTKQIINFKYYDMKEKVKLIFELMEKLGVSLDDLRIYDDSIEATGKFPLEIYYLDKTKSFDLEYYYKGQNEGRFPLGVVINNTVYTLASFVKDISCGSAEIYCRTNMPRGIICTLPTAEQLAVLSDNLHAYNKISEFVNCGTIMGKSCYAIAHKENGPDQQYYRNMKSRAVSADNSWHFVLPVINL